MGKSRYTKEQIAVDPGQGEAGRLVDEICRKMGVAEATCFRWKRKYAGLGVTKFRELREVREENRKLQGGLPDLRLGRTSLRKQL